MPKFSQLKAPIRTAVNATAVKSDASKDKIIDYLHRYFPKELNEVKDTLIREALEKAINQYFRLKNRFKTSPNQADLFSDFAGIPEIEQLSPHISELSGLPSIQRPQELPVSVIRLIVLEDESKPRKQSAKIKSYKEILRMADEKKLSESTKAKDVLA